MEFPTSGAVDMLGMLAPMLRTWLAGGLGRAVALPHRLGLSYLLLNTLNDGLIVHLAQFLPDEVFSEPVY